MYYYIKGTLALLAGDTAVIDAGGIGYRLTVTQNTFAALASKLGKEAQLFTYLAVRDDAMELYGFASEEEKLFFTKLLSVSGIVRRRRFPCFRRSLRISLFRRFRRATRK